LWGASGTTLNVVKDIVNIGVTPYTEYTVDGLVATSALTRLEFLGRQDPGFDSLDDIDVEGVSSAVPEPSALILMGTALISMLAFVRWR